MSQTGKSSAAVSRTVTGSPLLKVKLKISTRTIRRVTSVVERSRVSRRRQSHVVESTHRSFLTL